MAAESQDPRRVQKPTDISPRLINADSVTPIAPPRSAIPTMKNVLYAGWVTGVTAAVVCVVIRFIGWIFRVQFLVLAPGTDELQPVHWLGVIFLPLIAGLLGGLVAGIFLNVKRNKGWVLWLGTLAFLFSLAGPISQLESTWPTRILLILMHVVTYLIVVPQVARVVGDSDPRITKYFRDDSPASD